MMNKFSTDKKRILSNFFSLSSIEMANYLFPLITVPYLVRVLGPGKYGLIAFAMAFIQYFTMITDYGFTLTATRNISVSRDDPHKLSKIFSTVMAVKLIFMLASLIVLCIVVCVVPKFQADVILYLFAFGVVFGNVLFPIWFFQGMEKMKSIAVLNLLARTVFLCAIFIFVKNESDYLYVPLITSLGSILSGIISLFIILIHFKIRIILPSLREIREQLSEGWNVFISMMSISLVTTSNTFILGFFASNEAVGFFSAGEKIISLANRAFYPVFVAVYPHIAKIADAARDVAVKKLRKLFVLILLISGALSAGIFIFSGTIVAVAFGARFAPSVTIIRILAPLAFIVPMAYIFANLALLPFKLDRYFARIYIFGGILNVVLLLASLCFFRAGAAGVALSVLATQVTITTMMYIVLRRNNIKIVNLDLRSFLAVFQKKAIIEN